MGHVWRVSPKTDPQFVSSIHQLVVSTSRNVIVVAGGAYLVWQSAATASYPETYDWKMAPVALTAVLTCALALRLLGRWFLAAQVIWPGRFHFSPQSYLRAGPPCCRVM